MGVVICLLYVSVIYGIVRLCIETVIHLWNNKLFGGVVHLFIINVTCRRIPMHAVASNCFCLGGFDLKSLGALARVYLILTFPYESSDDDDPDLRSDPLDHSSTDALHADPRVLYVSEIVRLTEAANPSTL